jgi:hypothetical protein
MRVIGLAFCQKKINKPIVCGYTKYGVIVPNNKIRILVFLFLLIFIVIDFSKAFLLSRLTY